MSKYQNTLALCLALTLGGCASRDVLVLPSSYTSNALAQGKAKAMQKCGGPVWVWDVKSETTVQPFRVYWTVLYRCKATTAFIGPYQIVEDL